MSGESWQDVGLDPRKGAQRVLMRISAIPVRWRFFAVIFLLSFLCDVLLPALCAFAHAALSLSPDSPPMCPVDARHAASRPLD